MTDDEDEPKRRPTLEERVARMETITAICARAVLDHLTVKSVADHERLQAFWEDVVY